MFKKKEGNGGPLGHTRVLSQCDKKNTTKKKRMVEYTRIGGVRSWNVMEEVARYP